MMHLLRWRGNSTKHGACLRLGVRLAIIFGGVLLGCTSRAANVIWTNTATSAISWLAATNWNPNQVPGPTDNAQFGNAPITAQTYAIDMGAAGGLFEVGSIEITSTRSATTTIANSSSTTAGTLQIDQTGGGVFAIRTAGASVFLTNGVSQAMNVSFNTTSSAVIDCGSGSGVFIGSAITTAPFGITKVGFAALTLTGVNTYTGKTVISNGVVNINSDASLGSAPSSFVADQLQLRGGFVAATSSFTLDANRGITVSGSSAVNVLGAGNDFVIAGVISGTGAITKQTANTTNTLMGANTFSGGYLIAQGTLRLGNKSAIGTGTLSVLGDFGAAVNLTGVNAVTNNINVISSAVRIPAGGSPMELAGSVSLFGTTTITNGSDTTISRGISGNADLIRQGNTGFFTLKGTNTYTGNTYFCAGTNVLAGNDNPLPATIVSIGTNASSARLVLGDGSGPCNQTIADLQTFGTGTANAIVGGNAGISTLTVKPAGLKTFAGAIGGPGANENNVALTIDGAGHGLVLVGTNTYSGDTMIVAGKLQVGADTALPNGAVAGNMIVNAAAAAEGLDLAGFSPTVNGLSGSGNVFASTGTSTLSVGANDASSTFSGVIQNGSGTVALSKTGSGTLILIGANTYSGGTTIAGGALQGTTTSLQRDIANSASLVFDQTSSGTYSSVISGSGSVTKQNSGKLILSNTSTYTGKTFVNGGTLQVEGSIAGSSVTVNSGGVLAGNGIVGTVAIATGGAINAGASPGTLTTGAQTWNSGGTNIWEINDFNGTAGGDPGWDIINATSLNIAANSGNPFVVRIVSLNGTSAGDAANFNNASDYDRVIVHTTSGITGSGVAALQVDSSGFSNPLAATGFWYLTISGNDLVLSYRRAPVITANPVSITKQYGDTADFSVGAIGSTFTYQWRKDGGNIAGATTSIYHIDSAVSTDAGTYACVVSNSAGAATSAGATLTYTSQLPTVTTQPDPATQTVAIGATVSYSAAANSALTVSVQWTHDGNNISGATNTSLTLNNVQVADAGSYRAVFTNPDGSATSDAAVLIVTPTVVYVNGSFGNPVAGQDPDGAGPAVRFGTDSFATIQEGINALTTGGVVNIAGGTYVENLAVPRANIEIAGAGQGVVLVESTNSAAEPCTNAALCSAIAGVLVQGTNVSIHGLTVDGNNSGTTNTVGIVADGSISDVSVSLNNCAIKNHQYGVYASGTLAKVKVESCDVRGCIAAALYAESGAIMDAGNCGADVTGFGSSSGGNDVSGYLSGPAKAAVNTSATLMAQKNNFGATTNSADISTALTGNIQATQSPLVASDLPPLSIECLTSVPVAATNLSQFTEQGGSVSALSATVTSTDTATTYDGVITRMYNLTDSCGQTTEAHQIISIHDAHAPAITTCPADRTLSVDAGCAVVVPNLIPEVSVTDNCDTSLVTITQSPVAGSLLVPGITNVTITATDKGSNSATCTVTLTITDVTAPVLSGVPGDVTVDCSSVPTAATPTATDNCDSNPTIGLSPISTQQPSGCARYSYTITRTWTATDSSANSSSATQVITVVDTTAPVLSNVPGDTTVDCNSVPTVATPTATDNCATSPSIAFNEATTQTGSGCGHFNYAITRTWTASDECGNSSIAQQVITVHDITAPVLSAAPADVTVQCDSIPSPATLTATDTCDSTPTVTLSQTNTPGNCGGNYVLTRTWTATDACGNSSSRTQQITVIDTTAPVLSGVPGDITAECSSVPAPAHPTAVDNCDTNPVIALSQTMTNGALPGHFVLIRTWTATDACGNSSSASQQITGTDTLAPVLSGVPADVTVQCDAVPIAASPTASDCDPHPTIVLNESSTQTPSGCGHANYVITRTWTATDASGNSNSQTQSLTVQDTTAPTLSGVPADVTVQCGSVPDVAAPTASDNCDASPSIAFSETSSQTETGCGHANYTITRTWTATDVCGNSRSSNQVITVHDSIAPVLAGVPADATVTCSTIPDAATPTATDNCDTNPVVTLVETSTQVGAGCGHQNYTLTRTWTATDVCGNTSTAAQVITVRSSAPTITQIPADATYSCANLVPAANDGLVSAHDTCSGVVVISHSTDVISAMTCANRYTITRTYIATGACGDSSSQSQTITVNDTTSPVITAFPSDATLDCVCLVPAANDNSVAATDGCGGTVTISHAADVVTNVVDARHYQIVRTYTATDACGNATNRGQIFTMVIAGVPTVTFTGSNDIRVTNAVYTISGTAFGDRPITSVFYSLNNGPFTAANGASSWQANLVLAPGTNIVAAYAVDNLTNSSTISNAVVFYIVTNKLTVTVQDWPGRAQANSGLFSPSLNGAGLEIGRNYTMTAASGINLHRFVGWAASTDLTVPVYSTNPTLTFKMQPGLTLVARFENPFFHSTGSWLGLFSEGVVDPRSAGSISFNLPGGKDQSVNTFSGNIRLGGYKYAFSRQTGVFDATGHSHFVVGGPQTLTVDLYLDLAGHSTTITGTVSTVDWTANVTAYRNLTNHSIVIPARYTAILPPQTGPTPQPIGSSFAAFNLSGTGNVTLSGGMSDNATITESAKVSQDFKWPLYVQLYKNANGLLWGWLQFTNGQPGVTGTVYWFHPSGVTNGGYNAGFSSTISVVGSPYNGSASPSLSWPGNGFVLLYDDVHQGVTNKVQLSANTVSIVTTDVNYPATNKLSVKISKNTGLVTGAFLNPTRHRTDKIKGVLLQNQSNAAGFFVGTNVGAYLMQSQ